MNDARISTSANFLANVCHTASASAGWWGAYSTDDQKVPDDVKIISMGTRFGDALVAQKLCLIHSEISEAMEGHRKGLMDDKLPQYPMVLVELADAVIREMDLAGALILPGSPYTFGDIIAAKLAFNAQRADHKPEARAAAGGKAY